jgi:hypothetical protein
VNREPELISVLEELEDSLSYLEDLCADLGDRRLLRLVRLLNRVLKAIRKHIFEEDTG